MESRHQNNKGLNSRGRFNVALILASLIASILLVSLLINPAPKKQESQDSNQFQLSQTSSSSSQTSTKTAQWKTYENPVKIPILMYHAIHVMDPSEAANANLIVDPELFEAQVKAMVEAGYYFLTPEEAYKALTENALPAEKVVWLTFDDGDEDFYTNAYPILKKYEAKGTNNIITSFVKEGRPSNLTLDQMQEMMANGMSFQSHTVTHPDLSVTASSSQDAELTESKTYLEKNLDQKINTIAYPSGRYNSTTLALAKENYQLGLTTNEGLASANDGLLSLNRIRILPTTTPESLLETMATNNH